MFGPWAAAQTAAAPPAGVVVDRIAAVVDGTPVLASEVTAAAWYARWSAHADAAPELSAAERDAALQHLIDGQVLGEARDNEGYGGASPAVVAAQWQRLQTAAGGPGALAQKLARYHLSPAAAEAILARQLGLAAFLDQHFSATLVASPQQIQDYYDHVFAPAARSRGLTPAPLDAVRGQITAVLHQQQLDTLEPQWLAQLRAAAKVEILPRF